MSGVGIQGMSTVNWSPTALRSNRQSRISDCANVASDTASAQARLFCGKRRGMVSDARNPTSGMLLLTNDTAFAERVTNPDFKVPKTSLVKPATRLSDEDLDRLRRGLDLKD